MYSSMRTLAHAQGATTTCRHPTNSSSYENFRLVLAGVKEDAACELRMR
jgi:hypothetical protein